MLSNLLWASLDLLMISAFISMFSSKHYKTSSIVFLMSLINNLTEDQIKYLSNSANLTVFEVIALTDAITAYIIYKYGDFGKFKIPLILALFILTHTAYLITYQLKVFDTYYWYSLLLITLNILQLLCFRGGIVNAIIELDNRNISNISSRRYNNSSFNKEKSKWW